MYVNWLQSFVPSPLAHLALIILPIPWSLHCCGHAIPTGQHPFSPLRPGHIVLCLGALVSPIVRERNSSELYSAYPLRSTQKPQQRLEDHSGARMPSSAE